VYVPVGLHLMAAGEQKEMLLGRRLYRFFAII
jgi:hypothetical protein